MMMGKELMTKGKLAIEDKVKKIGFLIFTEGGGNAH